MRIDNEVLDVLRDGLRADDEGRTVVIEQQLDPAFRSSGTSVRTCILRLQKRA